MSNSNSKLAVVTGAGVRLGKATAVKLAQSGYDVVIHYNSSLAPAQETAAAVARSGLAPGALLERPPRPKQPPRTESRGPKSGQDHQQRSQERPRTANKGTKTAQGRQHRPQELPKIANKGAKSGPRPPT